MAFNNRYSATKRFLANPQDLRFTQLDIKSTFSDGTYLTVRDIAYLLRHGPLSPNALGDLHVSIDQQGHFMPRIRGEASRVQIPPPPTSGRNAIQLQKEPSLLGSVSAGYSKRHSHQDEEDEDELEDMFSHLDIKSTFSGPTYPTHRELVSVKQWGEVNPDDPIFMPCIRGGASGVQICKQKDVVFMPTILDRESGVQNTKRNDAVFMPRIRAGPPIPPPPTFNEDEGKVEDEDDVEYCLSPLHDYDYELYW
ncbi:hypothetical protein SUGI_0092300 [Cryptomeria japonica]|nr:hypothetical protein SUGI_0092300 [Cryptomeria japonica]